MKTPNDLSLSIRKKKIRILLICCGISFLVGIELYLVSSNLFFQNNNGSNEIYSPNTASSEFTREKDKMVMVYVQEGDFLMGGIYGLNDERPTHTVYLDSFWIDKYEVTNSQFASCVANGPCSVSLDYLKYDFENYYDVLEYSDYPVVVNWYNAYLYCEWVGGSLPTEAQWDKAARGIDGRSFPWGNDNPDCRYTKSPDCIEDSSSIGTTLVGSFPLGSSPYGVMDMAGNVSEWVSDWYDDSYPIERSIENPMGPQIGDAKVIRTATTMRHYANPLQNYGFRCVFNWS